MFWEEPGKASESGVGHRSYRGSGTWAKACASS